MEMKCRYTLVVDTNTELPERVWFNLDEITISSESKSYIPRDDNDDVHFVLDQHTYIIIWIFIVLAHWNNSLQGCGYTEMFYLSPGKLSQNELHWYENFFQHSLFCI
jgi:hypothetical protein